MPSTKPNTDLLSPYVIETFERTDEELVKLSLSDSRHFAVLMEKYKPKFTNYLKEKKYNYNFPKAEHDDILQEVFHSIFTSLESYNPDRAKFSTWAYSILRNEANGAFDKERVEVEEKITLFGRKKKDKIRRFDFLAPFRNNIQDDDFLAQKHLDDWTDGNILSVESQTITLEQRRKIDIALKKISAHSRRMIRIYLLVPSPKILSRITKIPSRKISKDVIKAKDELRPHLNYADFW